MEGEGDPEGQIGPVHLCEGLRVQEKEIGASLFPVKDHGHEDPVVFLDSPRASDKEELTAAVRSRIQWIAIRSLRFRWRKGK